MRTARSLAAALLLLSACLASAGARVLGKLGQTLQPASIHASPSSKSRVYYRAQSYTYLVLRGSPVRGWLRVLMSNGADGRVRESVVARLPYDVTYDPAKAPPPSRSLATGSGARSLAAQWGLRFIGTPYKWGGNDLQNGIDCSGFVQKLYGGIGLRLPRTAAEQAMVGTPITRLEHLQPGDRLYFWDHKRGKIGHTGIYLGNGHFVHSSSGRRGVATDSLVDPKWRKILVAARR
ncbi:MAG: C40 family peptidase [Fimbriimonadales bacterium]|nr:C40 family peptidase [Fimbriimonadales bacterium]